jgi:hypothetical protein
VGFNATGAALLLGGALSLYSFVFLVEDARFCRFPSSVADPDDTDPSHSHCTILGPGLPSAGVSSTAFKFDCEQQAASRKWLDTHIGFTQTFEIDDTSGDTGGDTSVAARTSGDPGQVDALVAYLGVDAPQLMPSARNAILDAFWSAAQNVSTESLPARAWSRVAQRYTNDTDVAWSSACPPKHQTAGHALAI